ncbi:MAG: hypothetical protein ACSHXB_05720 [Sulfitobacter sp.]
MGKTYSIAFAVSLIFATLGHAAPASLAIFRCSEVNTCDASKNCVANDTRVMIAQMTALPTGRLHFNMGPMVADVSGGLFLEQDWAFAEGSLPEPSGALGRANLLMIKDGIEMTAHVYRPGREVSGLNRADWVRADYACKQVMF